MHKAFRKAIRESLEEADLQEEIESVPGISAPATVPKKQRGRPRKNKLLNQPPVAKSDPTPKPRRGRAKRKLSSSSEETEAPLYVSQ